MSGFMMYSLIGIPTLVALIVTIFAIALHRGLLAFTAAGVVIFGFGILLNIAGLRHVAGAGFWPLLPQLVYDLPLQIGAAMLAPMGAIKLSRQRRFFRTWMTMKSEERKRVRLAREASADRDSAHYGGTDDIGML